MRVKFHFKDRCFKAPGREIVRSPHIETICVIRHPSDKYILTLCSIFSTFCIQNRLFLVTKIALLLFHFFLGFVTISFPPKKRKVLAQACHVSPRPTKFLGGAQKKKCSKIRQQLSASLDPRRFKTTK